MRSINSDLAYVLVVLYIMSVHGGKQKARDVWSGVRTITLVFFFASLLLTLQVLYGYKKPLQPMTLNSKVMYLALDIINTYDVGDTFTTAQFTEAVYQAYQGSDRDEVVASAPNQSKVKHVARWAQQKAKALGYIIRGTDRGQWVIV